MNQQEIAKGNIMLQTCETHGIERPESEDGLLEAAWNGTYEPAEVEWDFFEDRKGCVTFVGRVATDEERSEIKYTTTIELFHLAGLQVAVDAAVRACLDPDV